MHKKNSRKTANRMNEIGVAYGIMAFHLNSTDSCVVVVGFSLSSILSYGRWQFFFFRKTKKSFVYNNVKNATRSSNSKYFICLV